jgi:hypothetical protein
MTSKDGLKNFATKDDLRAILADFAGLLHQEPRESFVGTSPPTPAAIS